MLYTSDTDKVNELEALGLKMRRNEAEDRWETNVKRRATRADGSENTAPVVVDRSGKPHENIRKIGNDSVVNVILASFDYNRNGRQGTMIILNGVQVVEQIDFNPVEVTFAALD